MSLAQWAQWPHTPLNALERYSLSLLRKAVLEGQPVNERRLKSLEAKEKIPQPKVRRVFMPPSFAGYDGPYEYPSQ